MDRSRNQVSVRNPASTGGGEEPPRTFTFDRVFDESFSQQTVFEDTARPIINSVLDGYNGTIFAYGQTGTGKTHTMEGADTPELKGVIPRSFDHIFSSIDASDKSIEWLVRASFLEIYNDDVLDLLAEGGAKLELKENADTGIYVKGLQTLVVKSVKDLNDILQNGKKHRKVGSTLMNRDSSRSHCIFTVYIETSAIGPDGNAHIKAGKLNMVDLAGSERQSKTGAQGDRLKEAAKINLALSALGNVISALTSNKIGHVPYRDSKLTRLLQDSLGGNTKTVMIANIGPADYNFDETVNTLRFASRAKSIKNKPKINEDPKDAMLREFQDEIARLKAQLAEAEAMDAGGGMGGGDGAAYGDADAMYGAAAAAKSPGGMRSAGAPGRAMPTPARKKVILERIVEKEVLVGATPEELEEARRKAEAERQAAEKRHAQEREDMKRLATELQSTNREIAEELKKKERDIEEKRTQRAKMRAQLREMETQVLAGKEVLNEAEKNRKLIEKNKAELERQAWEKAKLEEEMRQRAETQIDLTQKFESLEKMAQDRTTRLQELMSKYTVAKQEIEDCQADNQREREELLDTIRELNKAIQLKQAILNVFVPKHEEERIEQRAEWNENSEEWSIRPVDRQELLREVRRPESVRASLHEHNSRARPVTDWARNKANQLLQLQQQQQQRAQVGATNGGLDLATLARFRSDNVVELELDMPDRTTIDYMTQAQAAAHHHQQLMMAAAAAGGDPNSPAAPYQQESQRRQHYQQQQQQHAHHHSSRMY